MLPLPHNMAHGKDSILSVGFVLMPALGHNACTLTTAISMPCGVP
jgi:hypothetical protein